ncbi:MAG TPA: hypothetical protein VKS82_25965 [Streptosporangiaceae bacterium]|nr:hypothetical protein [Streptosporangiaceae bacterium]
MKLETKVENARSRVLKAQIRADRSVSNSAGEAGAGADTDAGVDI